MSEDQNMTEAEPKIRTDRVDTVIQSIMWVLVAVVLVGGAWFGYTVWQSRQEAKYSSPAMRAIGELEDAVRADPNNAALRVRLGEALAAAGLSEEAIKSLEVALEIDPEHSGAYLDLGMIALLEEELGVAEGYFLKVIDLTAGTEYENLNSRREQAYFYLGQLALKQELYEDALGYLLGALDIRRDASDTYYNLALAYQGLEEPEKAYENVYIALEFDPNYPEARFLAGEILLELGDVPGAAMQFRNALDLVPEAESPREALAALGTVEEHVTAAEQALEDGNTTEALEEAVIAFAIDPTYGQGVKLYAMSLERSGDTTSAIGVYQEASQLLPEDSDIAEAIERLERAE